MRHAERESLSTSDPELTAAGRARARALVAVARETGVQAIITTQFARTGATAKPSAIVYGNQAVGLPDETQRFNWQPLTRRSDYFFVKYSYLLRM